MSEPEPRDWLAIVGNFSVVAGLILVAFQINQSSHLVRAELGSISFDRLISIDQIYTDASFAEVWAKSHEQPEDLTLAEMVQLDGFLLSYLDFLEAENFLYDLDIYKGSIDVAIPSYVGVISGNRFAMAWWAETKWMYGPYMADLIDQQIANPSDEKLDIERYRRIMSRL